MNENYKVLAERIRFKLSNLEQRMFVIYKPRIGIK